MFEGTGGIFSTGSDHKEAAALGFYYPVTHC